MNASVATAPQEKTPLKIRTSRDAQVLLGRATVRMADLQKRLNTLRQQIKAAQGFKASLEARLVQETGLSQVNQKILVVGKKQNSPNTESARHTSALQRATRRRSETEQKELSLQIQSCEEDIRQYTQEASQVENDLKSVENTKQKVQGYVTKILAKEKASSTQRLSAPSEAMEPKKEGVDLLAEKSSGVLDIIPKAEKLTETEEYPQARGIRSNETPSAIAPRESCFPAPEVSSQVPEVLSQVSETLPQVPEALSQVSQASEVSAILVSPEEKHSKTSSTSQTDSVGDAQKKPQKNTTPSLVSPTTSNIYASPQESPARPAHRYEWLSRVIPSPKNTQGQKIGPFTIERELGRGAQAVVLLGRDCLRSVALKVIDVGHVKKSVWNAILQEAQRLAQFRHPNIVTVFSFSEAKVSNGIGIQPSRVAYIALEYMKDGNLSDLEEKAGGEGKLGLDVIMEACGGAARGITAIHDLGALHRDIKPQNILADDGAYRVADLGIATNANNEWSRVTGSLGFIAPEILDAYKHREMIPYGKSTDIFALGATAYRLVTGKTPLQAIRETRFPNDPDLAPENHPKSERLFRAYQIFDGAELPDPRLFRSNIPDEVVRVIMKTTALNPEERFPDAESVAKAFHLAWEKCSSSGVRKQQRKWSWW